MRPLFNLLVFFFLCFNAAGCVSSEDHAAERTARLRELYPPGMSKGEVQARWEPVKPDFSASRPTDGWPAYPDEYIAKKMSDTEARTGQRIESVDRYWGPDGWMSLCYCWYYYDSEGRIVDVEWQYMSD